MFCFVLSLYLIKVQRKAKVPICVWPDKQFFNTATKKNDWGLRCREWRRSCLGEMVMRATVSICLASARGPGTSQQSDHTICKCGEWLLNVLICCLSNVLCFSIFILFYNNNSILTFLEPVIFCVGRFLTTNSGFFFELASYNFPKTLPIW